MRGEEREKEREGLTDWLWDGGPISPSLLTQYSSWG